MEVNEAPLRVRIFSGRLAEGGRGYHACSNEYVGNCSKQEDRKLHGCQMYCTSLHPQIYAPSKPSTMHPTYTPTYPNTISLDSVARPFGRLNLGEI